MASLSLSKTKKLPEKRVRLCCQFPFLSENVCLYVKSLGRRLVFFCFLFFFFFYRSVKKKRKEKKEQEEKEEDKEREKIRKQ